MKKFLIFLAIISMSTLFFEENKVEASISCPLTAGPGEIIVNLNSTRLYSTKYSPSSATVSANVPAGTYNITAVTYDDHASHGGQNQHYEILVFTFRDSAGNIAGTSATKDIPENANTQTSNLGTYTLSRDATSVFIQHAAGPMSNYQSLEAVCLKLANTNPDPDLTVSCSASPSSTNVNETVTWNANASGGNGTYTYSWSGADTNGQTNKTFTKTYSSSGTKTATVTVSSGSKSKTATCNVNIQEQSQLTGSCSASPNRTGIDKIVTWEVFASGGNGSYTYDWSGANLDGEHDKIETKSYSSTGTKTATVTIRSNDGQTRSVSCSTLIEEIVNDFDVYCKASDTRIEEGDSVTFTANVSGGNSPFEYNWSGDISGDEKSETVRFNKSGRYDVRVTVTDDDGRYKSDTCPIIIVEDDDEDDLDVVCKVSDNSVYTDERVTFTAVVDGGNSPFTYRWRGDIRGDSRTESVRFTEDGRYEVRLTVEDDDGNIATDTCPVVRVSDRNIGVITTTFNQPPTGQLASLSSVFLSQVPYTGAKEILTIIGYIALVFVWSIGIVYLIARRKSRKIKTNKIETFKNSNKEALVIQ